MKQFGTLLFSTGFVCAVSFLLCAAALHEAAPAVLAGQENSPAIAIDYPLNESIFPPEITPPTFLWRDASQSTNLWRIEVKFANGSPAMHFESHGDHLSLGEIDQRCISATNELPRLTPEQAAAHAWKPDPKAWENIKKHSVSGPAEVFITGFSQSDHKRAVSSGRVYLQTSKDPVRAPIFYRDVPLMPSETEKGVIKPLASGAIQLIQWRLRSIDQRESKIVLTGMHTCANCHSFSLDGKIMGMDMDGPRNDKGLYAVVPIKQQITIRASDMVSWNPSQDRQFALNRVGFMSQVSPDGKYVLTMVTAADRPPQNNYYVTNFKDYRFLQVFYPTRGILAWFDRASGERHPLPGADDPRYVQTNGVWSPDGKYVVFARAEAREPYPPGRKLAEFANDPNEIQIQYDLYRVPFNDGKGGEAEPILGASANGMSNSFPKVSPDGRWIVFVKCNNGQVMRPDSQLYIVPAQGGEARRLRANTSRMNSWHSFSPNGHWLVFSSKSRSPYTQMYLTHIDENGNDSPAILIENSTAANRAVNIPEFVNIPPDGMQKINTPAVDMYRQFDYAVGLGEKGQNDDAIAQWKELAAANPDDARIHNNLGAALARVGKFEEAISEYQKALELNPQYHLVHGNLAKALRGAGQLDEAVLEFQTAIDFFPDAPDLRNSFGSTLAGLGRVDAAATQFEKAIELNPDLAEAHNNLGKALLSEGQSKQPGRAAEAEKEFKTAISLDPHYADAENNLGTLYGQEGNDAEAERLFREAVKNNPAFAQAFVNLGAALAGESRFSEAEEALQKALLIEPSNREAQELRAMIKAQGNH
jgi:Flp pilus assembly protein TadD/Tol biopolymer transport system component